jgi:hypothetical protein
MIGRIFFYICIIMPACHVSFSAFSREQKEVKDFHSFESSDTLADEPDVLLGICPDLSCVLSETKEIFPEPRAHVIIPNTSHSQATEESAESIDAASFWSPKYLGEKKTETESSEFPLKEHPFLLEAQMKHEENKPWHNMYTTIIADSTNKALAKIFIIWGGPDEPWEAEPLSLSQHLPNLLLPSSLKNEIDSDDEFDLKAPPKAITITGVLVKNGPKAAIEEFYNHNIPFDLLPFSKEGDIGQTFLEALSKASAHALSQVFEKGVVNPNPVFILQKMIDKGALTFFQVCLFNPINYLTFEYGRFEGATRILPGIVSSGVLTGLTHLMGTSDYIKGYPSALLVLVNAKVLEVPLEELMTLAIPNAEVASIIGKGTAAFYRGAHLSYLEDSSSLTENLKDGLKPAFTSVLVGLGTSYLSKHPQTQSLARIIVLSSYLAIILSNFRYFYPS